MVHILGIGIHRLQWMLLKPLLLKSEALVWFAFLNPHDRQGWKCQDVV